MLVDVVEVLGILGNRCNIANGVCSGKSNCGGTRKQEVFTKGDNDSTIAIYTSFKSEINYYYQIYIKSIIPVLLNLLTCLTCQQYGWRSTLLFFPQLGPGTAIIVVCEGSSSSFLSLTFALFSSNSFGHCMSFSDFNMDFNKKLFSFTQLPLNPKCHNQLFYKQLNLSIFNMLEQFSFSNILYFTRALGRWFSHQLRHSRFASHSAR